jgi:putative tryptophan/tyrosine transport system substrate-binding protein
MLVFRGAEQVILMMKRREVITILGATTIPAMLWPLAVRAQQPLKEVTRIGFLRVGPASGSANRVEALQTGLRELGYDEGKNIVIEFRWAETVDQLPGLAAELARMNVDVIFAMSSTEVEAARQATKTIPIVFALHADPVGLGHVASLARPGGNITGLTIVLSDLVAKQLELLKEAVPQAARIGVLFSPTAPSHRPALQAIETAGQNSVRRAAIYVDKILKGVKPAALAVEQASKYQLIINLKTAKAIDLTIPESFLLRADELIE